MTVANPGDTVSIAAGTYTEDVTVTKSITLRGAGSGTTAIADTGGGDTATPVVFVDGRSSPGLDVGIDRLSVKGTTNSFGVLIDTADTDIDDSVVTGNGYGGVQTEQQAVGQAPHLKMSHSTVVNNSGGGVDLLAGAAAVDHSAINDNYQFGFYIKDATAAVSTSTIDGSGGNGILLLTAHSSARVTHSTISHTRPYIDPDGPIGGSAVEAFDDASATIDNSTLYGNSYQAVVSVGARITVGNSTIAGTVKPRYDNDSPNGAVVTKNYGTIARGSIIISGSIVTASAAVPACAGAIKQIHDEGYNLASDATCHLSATGSHQKVSPKLGAFAENGGPTKTLLPANTSPAVDAIPLGSAHCDRQTTDQRGVARPEGPKCDIGAVELAQKPLVITTASLPKGRVGKSYRAQLKATGGLGKPYSYAHSGSLPEGVKLSTSGLISGKPAKPGKFAFAVTVDKRVSKKFDSRGDDGRLIA